jgi:hypothetical protein
MKFTLIGSSSVPLSPESFEISQRQAEIKGEFLKREANKRLTETF